MVFGHLLACAQEAKERFPDIAETPAAAGLVAIHLIINSAAWSLGSSLASNNVAGQPFLLGMLEEVEREFRKGYALPGAGVML